jgi:RND family efflux transporter MFP subunit
MQSFEKVTAPFPGTIKARYIDTGALIASGTNTVLFRLATISTLRVYANVPESYAKNVAPGGAVEVETPAVAGNKLSGHVIRTAGAIDPVSRTLLTEIRVPNPDLALVPGEFGEVTFHLHNSKPTFVISSSSLLFRAQGTQVALVDDSGRVRIQNIQVGRDLGNTVEVLSGITANDSVIENPSDSITDATLVSVQHAPVE